MDSFFNGSETDNFFKGTKGNRKVLFFSGPATNREGEGVRAWPLRKMTWEKKMSKKMWPLSLSGRATKK